MDYAELSDWKEVKGVPQESVLGPISFNIFRSNPGARTRIVLMKFSDNTNRGNIMNIEKDLTIES